MAVKVHPKTNKRIVMYVPSDLCYEIKNWVGENFTTLSDFGREAFRYYLKERRKEQVQQQLVESCIQFNSLNGQINEEWQEADGENWPMRV
ncbi:MAG: hypothetical protein D6743_08165 [Calditrichaeota bacterium]|nr:MAG: hypothetical protein D6743_08165 [Calditrichota bacterium]